MTWNWHPGHVGMGPGGWIGMGFMVAFWIAIIIGMIFLIRHIAARPTAAQCERQWTRLESDRREPSKPESPALSILEERYARGDIDQAEFLAKRADLTRDTK